MKTVYKYELNTVDEQCVLLPHGAEILCVQVQHNTPCVWAVVDSEAPASARIFYIYGTGQLVPVDRVQFYVGTYQLHGGALVFHVYVN